MLVPYLLYLIRLFLNIYLIYIILTWFPGLHDKPWFQALNRFFEIFQKPVRAVFQPIGPLDLSPLIIFVILNLFTKFIIMFYYG